MSYSSHYYFSLSHKIKITINKSSFKVTQFCLSGVHSLLYRSAHPSAILQTFTTHKNHQLSLLIHHSDTPKIRKASFPDTEFPEYDNALALPILQLMQKKQH